MTTTTTTSSPQLWLNAILLIAAIAAAVLSSGFVDATSGTVDSSCATVLCPAPSNCKNGKCTLICPAGFKNCNVRVDDGCETNVKDGDVQNCGKCGRECHKPKSYEFANCENGKCKYTDRCSAIKCRTYPNSSTTCTKAQCRVTCNPTFGDCNGVREDGCESGLEGDVNNCGRCGNKCTGPGISGMPECRKGSCL